MKKLIAVLLALSCLLAFAACGQKPVDTTPTTTAPAATTPTTQPATEPSTEPTEPGVTVMTYAEYAAAAMDAPVVVEFYVQATQSWWNDQIVVYGQDENGGYLAYNLACSEEDAAKLTAGTKIRVTGFKGEYAGEVEIVDGTFEFVEAEAWIAEPTDVTALLGTEELAEHMNKKVSFTGLTVKAIDYKNGEPGDDIYVTVGYNGADYSFCVERYLTDPETEVYKAFADLTPGTVVNMEGFLYWYNGVNTHITSVSAFEDTKSEGVMTYAEYDAAELDAAVVVEFYVQATQSWWNNQIVVYGQDLEGGYLAYNLACSEEDAAKLTAGTKIRVTGFKGEYAGEVEIVDGTFEFVEAEAWIAEPTDVTALLGTEELAEHMNKKVSFTGLTIEAIEYKNGEPGDDIYVTVGCNGASYSFCVERYLTDPDTEVYKAFATLTVGAVVDIQGFLYWYNGVNTHITGITVTG